MVEVAPKTQENHPSLDTGFNIGPRMRGIFTGALVAVTCITSGCGKLDTAAVTAMPHPTPATLAKDPAEFLDKTIVLEGTAKLLKDEHPLDAFDVAEGIADVLMPSPFGVFQGRRESLWYQITPHGDTEHSFPMHGSVRINGERVRVLGHVESAADGKYYLEIDRVLSHRRELKVPETQTSE